MNQLHRSATLAAAAVILLVACGGGDNNETGPKPGITVSGVAQDRGGEPISGATVVVAGKSPVTTGPDGRFSIPNVIVPYDITLVPSGNTALTYQGVTRPDPTLLLFDFAGVPRSATISGTVPPTGSGSGTTTSMFFVSGADVSGSSNADTTGHYGFTVSWRGAANTQVGRLYLLQWTPDSAGLPASFEGYASKPLAITDGGNHGGNDFTAADLTDPPEQTISGTVSLPVGYTQAFRRLFMFFDSVPVFWHQTANLGGTFTYTVPAVNGVKFAVGATAVDAASRSSFFFKNGITGSSSGIAITLEPAQQLSLPSNGAGAVDATTTFSWSGGGEGGVYFVDVTPANSTNPAFALVTTALNAKIPDLATAGLGLPASAIYHWDVDKIFPVAAIDDVADGSFLDLIGWPAEVGETLSESFAFTTSGPAGTLPSTRLVSPTAAAADEGRFRGLTGGLPAIPAQPH